MTILIAQHDQKAALIPEWVNDLESFRRWACSDDFPESGWYAHLEGQLWVDTSMERLGHNRLKTGIITDLDVLTKSARSGMVLGDRMLLTNIAVGLSTEPDGMFLRYESVRKGAPRLEQGASSVEVMGTPDMVLEVVSQTSGRKDRVILPKLYHEAGVSEYWIAEPTGESATLDILTWTPQRYVSAVSIDGWLQSSVFGKSFRVTSSKDPVGLPLYQLEIK